MLFNDIMFFSLWNWLDFKSSLPIVVSIELKFLFKKKKKEEGEREREREEREELVKS